MNQTKLIYVCIYVPICQGHTSTKIVGEPRSRKKVGHQCRPTEKILDFEWSKRVKMALKFLSINLI